MPSYPEFFNRPLQPQPPIRPGSRFRSRRGRRIGLPASWPDGTSARHSTYPWEAAAQAHADRPDPGQDATEDTGHAVAPGQVLSDAVDPDIPRWARPFLSPWTIAAVVLLFCAGMSTINTWWALGLGIAALALADRLDRIVRPHPRRPLMHYFGALTVTGLVVGVTAGIIGGVWYFFVL